MCKCYLFYTYLLENKLGIADHVTRCWLKLLCRKADTASFTVMAQYHHLKSTKLADLSSMNYRYNIILMYYDSYTLRVSPGCRTVEISATRS